MGFEHFRYYREVLYNFSTIVVILKELHIDPQQYLRIEIHHRLHGTSPHVVIFDRKAFFMELENFRYDGKVLFNSSATLL